MNATCVRTARAHVILLHGDAARVTCLRFLFSALRRGRGWRCSCRWLGRLALGPYSRSAGTPSHGRVGSSGLGVGELLKHVLERTEPVCIRWIGCLMLWSGGLGGLSASHYRKIVGHGCGSEHHANAVKDEDGAPVWVEGNGVWRRNPESGMRTRVDLDY